jgi:hypothetical protein
MREMRWLCTEALPVCRLLEVLLHQSTTVDQQRNMPYEGNMS